MTAGLRQFPEFFRELPGDGGATVRSVFGEQHRSRQERTGTGLWVTASSLPRGPPLQPDPAESQQQLPSSLPYLLRGSPGADLAYYWQCAGSNHPQALPREPVHSRPWEVEGKSLHCWSPCLLSAQAGPT